MKFEFAGTTCYYKEIGSGKPLLLVHGWGGSSQSLLSLAKRLKDSYKVYMLDLPGFGKSEAPKSAWGVDEYSAFVSEFLEQVIKTPVIYFGHSFGGGIGVYLAANLPSMFDRLILCGAAIIRNPTEARASKIIKKVIPFYSSFKKYFRPARKLYYKIFYPRSDLLKNEHLEGSFRKIINQDLSSYLPKITTPTLILWGSEDSYTPVKQSHIIHEAMSGSKLEILTGASHSLPLEQSEWVYKNLVDFIDRK
ncbi:alpha/beta hydrolase [Candidatus Nomurabacteria bacterium]|nr:alpha/beta hydrolase [Candidatus Nomurabacteria bacterium]